MAKRKAADVPLGTGASEDQAVADAEEQELHWALQWVQDVELAFLVFGEL